MAISEIDAGICGFITSVTATRDGKACRLTITSNCKGIQQLAWELTEVDPLEEISSRRAIPKTLQAGLKHCIHSACPAPAGIIKAVEVETNPALPKDTGIKVFRD